MFDRIFKSSAVANSKKPCSFSLRESMFSTPRNGFRPTAISSYFAKALTMSALPVFRGRRCAPPSRVFRDENQLDTSLVAQKGEHHCALEPRDRGKLALSGFLVRRFPPRDLPMDKRRRGLAPCTRIVSLLPPRRCFLFDLGRCGTRRPCPFGARQRLSASTATLASPPARLTAPPTIDFDRPHQPLKACSHAAAEVVSGPIHASNSNCFPTPSVPYNCR